MLPTPPDPRAPQTPAALRARLAGRAVAAAALALTLLALAGYPIAPALFAAGLLLYAVALWVWPCLWLVVVPAALPALDLAPWTGWSFVEEPDLVVLVTIAVLALRTPPRRGDFVFSGLAGVALALTLFACVLGIVRGLVLPGPPGGSAIAELRPDNALRVAKGLAIALALLPFLRRALATRADASRLFAAGMSVGLALVGVAALYERALFTGLLDFDSPYRIVATFSSMHFGGGYVGAYIAMALPFALALLGRSRLLALVPLAGIAALALYALVVTFARAAYASAIVGSVVLVFAWIYAGRKRRASAASVAVPLALLAIAAGIIATAATDSRFMEGRLGKLMPDLAWREQLWSEGLALRPDSVGPWLFGMGLGSYARTTRAAAPRAEGQGNVALKTDGATRYLAIESGQPLYIGQRIGVAPDQSYRLSFSFRSPDGDGVVAAILCEKMMLYSVRCSRRLEARPQKSGAWQRFEATIATGQIARRTRLRLFRRPTELAFFLPRAGSSADLTDVRLTDPAGRELVANGDFSHGLARWFPTDDRHTLWRIENQYMMILFEEELIGLGAFVLLAAVALGGILGALPRGDPMAPALAASLAAFLASALFDCPLEVPRLAALFYLVAFAAMTLGENAKGPVVAGQALL